MAELGQTQVMLEVIDEVVVEVRSRNCKESLSSTTYPGGWVKVKLKLELEFGNINHCYPK